VKSSVFWIITPCSSETAQEDLRTTSSTFLLRLLFNLEDRGNMFPQNVRLSLNYMVLQPKRPQSSHMINPFWSGVEIYSTLLPYQFWTNYLCTRLFRGSPFIFRSYCPCWPCMQYQRIRKCFFCLLLPSGTYSLNFFRSECHL
jgi:hypothetical protein